MQIIPGTVKDYIVAVGCDPSSLEVVVRDAAAKGYVPIGGVAVTAEVHQAQNVTVYTSNTTYTEPQQFPSTYFHYAQAMILLG